MGDLCIYVVFAFITSGPLSWITAHKPENKPWYESIKPCQWEQEADVRSFLEILEEDGLQTLQFGTGVYGKQHEGELISSEKMSSLGGEITSSLLSVRRCLFFPLRIFASSSFSPLVSSSSSSSSSPSPYRELTMKAFSKAGVIYYITAAWSPSAKPLLILLLFSSFLSRQRSGKNLHLRNKLWAEKNPR